MPADKMFPEEVDDHWSNQYDWRFFDWLQDNPHLISGGVAGTQGALDLEKAFKAGFVAGRAEANSNTES